MPDLLILINKFHQQQTDSQLLKTQGLKHVLFYFNGKM